MISPAGIISFLAKSLAKSLVSPRALSRIHRSGMGMSARRNAVMRKMLMSLPRPFWKNMTTVDFATADTSQWIAVLPVAAIERH